MSPMSHQRPADLNAGAQGHSPVSSVIDIFLGLVSPEVVEKSFEAFVLPYLQCWIFDIAVNFLGLQNAGAAYAGMVSLQYLVLISN